MDANLVSCDVDMFLSCSAYVQLNLICCRSPHVRCHCDAPIDRAKCMHPSGTDVWPPPLLIN
jgi:hypothetical protein